MNELKSKNFVMLKDIRDLSPDVDVSSDFSKGVISSSLTTKTFNELNVLKILELKDSSHLTLNVKKNTNFELAILMASDDKSLVVEAFLEENSFARIICFSNKKSLVKHNSVCEKNSRFEAVNFSTNELVADSVSRLKDDASCLIINSYLNKGVDSNIKDKVIHVGENNSSLISSRSYLLNSKSDSRGLIRIEPSAFNAQGFQESNSLIEGDSRFISVPDLEILNNEVKCSHGSTISRIKDEDLFYFESRGISKDEARKMLISGHVLGVLPSSQIKDFANDLLIDFLRGVSS